MPMQTLLAGGEKEGGKEGENALLAQVQALLQQQQQQVVAAQQIQVLTRLDLYSQGDGSSLDNHDCQVSHLE